MSIPTPPDLARGRVSWTIGRSTGTTLPGARGRVRFEPSATAVNYSTATIMPDPVETPVIAGVMTPVDLDQNDPDVWNWRVHPMVGVPWEPFSIDVDGPVNLATVAVVPGKGPVRAVKGDPGTGLTIRGNLTSPADLPAAAADGDGYMIVPDLWVRVEGAWINAGPIQGPEGVQGVPGIQGVQGETGLQGVRGEPGPLATPTVTSTEPGVYEISAEPWELTVPDVTGLQAALDGKASTTDPRLSDARTPTAHQHPVSDVTGLAARLAALEYDSGTRNMSTVAPGMTAGDWTLRRVGKVVYMALYSTRFTPTSGTLWQAAAGMIPAGFRPPAVPSFILLAPAVHSIASTATQGARVSRYGGVDIYDISGKTFSTVATWVTDDPVPTTLPGTPV